MSDTSQASTLTYHLDECDTSQASTLTYHLDECDTSQASTLTYLSTCPFRQLIKKSTCPTQSFSCPKKLIKITKTRE